MEGLAVSVAQVFEDVEDALFGPNEAPVSKVTNHHPVVEDSETHRDSRPRPLQLSFNDDAAVGQTDRQPSSLPRDNITDVTRTRAEEEKKTTTLAAKWDFYEAWESFDSAGDHIQREKGASLKPTAEIKNDILRGPCTPKATAAGVGPTAGSSPIATDCDSGGLRDTSEVDMLTMQLEALLDERAHLWQHNHRLERENFYLQVSDERTKYRLLYEKNVAIYIFSRSLVPPLPSTSQELLWAATSRDQGGGDGDGDDDESLQQEVDECLEMLCHGIEHNDVT